MDNVDNMDIKYRLRMATKIYLMSDKEKERKFGSIIRMREICEMCNIPLGLFVMTPFVLDNDSVIDMTIIAYMEELLNGTDYRE